MKLTALDVMGRIQQAAVRARYLLEHEGFAVLIDCGNGVLSRLQEFIEPSKLKAIIISHLHSDHCSDLLSCAMPCSLAGKRSSIVPACICTGRTGGRIHAPAL